MLASCGQSHTPASHQLFLNLAAAIWSGILSLFLISCIYQAGLRRPDLAAAEQKVARDAIITSLGPVLEFFQGFRDRLFALYSPRNLVGHVFKRLPSSPGICAIDAVLTAEAFLRLPRRFQGFSTSILHSTKKWRHKNLYCFGEHPTARK